MVFFVFQIAQRPQLSDQNNPHGYLRNGPVIEEDNITRLSVYQSSTYELM